MDGRVIVITGGFGALGRVVAEVAAKRGASVTALGRSAPPNDLAGRLGSSALLLDGVDLTDSKSCNEAFARVNARYGRLDALINVAGVFEVEKIDGGQAATWARLFAMNLTTTLNATQAALRYLLASDSGRIVNVGALSALKAGAGMGPYAASKSAVHRLTESLADELKGRGVTVNAVLPSIIDTPANRAAMPGAAFDQWVSSEALAEVMLFLASREAQAVTGALLPIAGGQ